MAASPLLRIAEWTGPSALTVLRRRSELSAVAGECADLALHCAERSRLDQPRREGMRCVLVWTGAQGRGKLGALFPFGSACGLTGLPLVALKSCTPLVSGAAGSRPALHALLDWFRADGEGAALLEFRGLARGGPVYRAFAEVARQREQLVFATSAARRLAHAAGGRRAWGGLTGATLPLAALGEARRGERGLRPARL